MATRTTLVPSRGRSKEDQGGKGGRIEPASKLVIETDSEKAERLSLRESAIAVRSFARDAN